MRIGILFFFFVLVCLSVNAQPGKSSKETSRDIKGWQANPFEQKVFIENKGQFAEQAGVKQEVLFQAISGGVDIYFTKTGVVYSYDEVLPKAESRGDAEEREEKEAEVKHHSLSVQWLGSNPAVEIYAEDKVSFYYTYGFNPKEQKEGIIANAYKKIIYHNLYPNIDAEYVFPEDKGGIKYSLILHPGSNSSDVKMKWDGEGISQDAAGNVIIKSSFGDFTDHAPKTFYEGGESINSAFDLTGNILSFKLETSNPKSETIIIDPWTTVPTTLSGSKAFDVNYDYSGNVFAYGLLKLAKFNSSGVLQWTFNCQPVISGGGFYGDFAVDAVSGTCYIGEGIRTQGARVAKVNSSGVQTGLYPGNPSMHEIWRMDYNYCNGTILVGGGGTTLSTTQAFVLDTNLINITPIQVLPIGNDCCHDVALLSIDKYSSFSYMLFALSVNFPSTFGNHLAKFPMPGLVPAAWDIPTGHTFDEIGSVTYVGGGSQPNGFNGMAISPNYVYTYDGGVIYKWDKNTNALVASKMVSGTKFAWGGLDVDECDNLYVGVQSSVRVYDASFALATTYTLTNTVYDLRISGTKLYACGNSFVSEINIPANSMSITLTQTPVSGCTCNGTASVSVVSCSNPSGYTYTWLPGGQTTQTAIGLCPGSYTVTLSPNCLITYTDSIIVTGGTNVLTATVTATSLPCTNNSSATVNGTGGTTPYTYSWSPSGQTSQTATGLSAGNYTVTVTDVNGCTNVQTVTIASGSITVTAGPSTTICSGDSAIISATGGGNYLWSTGATTAATTVSPTVTTTYSVIVSNGACADTAFPTVTVDPSLSVSVSGNTLLCTGDIATLTASGGTNYSWSNGSTSSTITVSPSTTATYVVFSTNGNCTSTDSIVVTVSPPPVANVSGTTICSGQTATLIASGGGNYTWSTGATTSSIALAATGTATYSVIVSVGTCADTAFATVTVNPSPVISVSGNTLLCVGDISTLTASGGTNYSWSSGSTSSSIIVSPGTTTTYTVSSSNSLCTSSLAITVTVSPTPVASSANAVICSGQTATLTAFGGGTYLWSTGATTSSITAAPASTATYSVIVSIGTCKDTASSTVTVNPNPIASAWSNTTIITGATTTLAASGGGTYIWSNGAVDSVISVSPPLTTVYCVTVSIGSCIDTACVIVYVEPVDCSPFSTDDAFVLPSAFSPNADGQNDKWHLLYLPLLANCIDDFQVFVYNRWGEKVFEGDDIAFSWDGTYNGKIEDTAVFGYYIEGTLKDGTEIKKKGNVSLLR